MKITTVSQANDTIREMRGLVAECHNLTKRMKEIDDAQTSKESMMKARDTTSAQRKVLIPEIKKLNTVWLNMSDTKIGLKEKILSLYRDTMEFRESRRNAEEKK